MIEDDTHDKLTKAYLEYYKANEKFEAANPANTQNSSVKMAERDTYFHKIRMDEIPRP